MILNDADAFIAARLDHAWDALLQTVIDDAKPG